MNPARLALAFVALSAAFSASAGDPPAVTVIHNATIHTAAENHPSASAMAYDSDGAIVALGDSATLLARHTDARHIDLAGKVVIPGLIDAHAHLMGLGMALMQVDLVGTGSKDEAIKRLKAFAASLPEDAWLLGRGWDQNDWPEKEFPDQGDLNQHFPDRPVWLRRIDGHAGWANSAALAAADRNLAGDWQPEGGRVVRDATGQATGVLVDRAMALVDEAVPEPGPEVLQEALRRALEKAASVGLTGVHEAGTSLQVMRLYRSFIDQGKMTLRIYAMADGDGAALQSLCDSGFVADPAGWLSMRSVKLYADGALGSRGAALLAPYSDDRDNRGLLIQSAETLAHQVDVGMGCGLQVNVHAIGDRGNRVVLDAIEAARSKHPDNPGRHRVEHAQVVALDDLPRFRELGLIASMQPTHATSDMYWAEDRVGPNRIQGAYAWRRLINLAVPLALGSDFPVERPNPMLGFHAAVTRQDARGWPEGGWYADQRLTRIEALRGFTAWAAHAAFAENSVGTLAAGKRADFVVLSQDILSVAAEKLLSTRVLSTVVNGQPVYQSPERVMAQQ
jgi:predicted amidohydrolase YtcJ